MAKDSEKTQKLAKAVIESQQAVEAAILQAKPEDHSVGVRIPMKNGVPVGQVVRTREQRER